MALPLTAPDRLPIGVCAYGLTYACGIAWGGTPRANPKPMTARGFIDRAASDGLGWVEMPPRLFEDASPSGLEGLRDYAKVKQVSLVIDSMNLLAGGLEEDMRLAKALGAPTVRFTLSSVLCGDRRGFPGGWRAHIQACCEALEALVPLAERLGITLAMENHQDADSDDLLLLCGRFESAHLGVTLDCGNPLAVMEEPLQFATRIARYLRHAHLKDYRIYRADNGFQLVRCAVGEGVVPFAGILKLLDAQTLPITRSIEMAALQARRIPFLERGWWDEYSTRDARDILPTLEVAWRNLRPAGEDPRTPMERNASGPELLAYEWEQHEKSVAYLRTLIGS